jgi:ADP-ribosylglycohydrolase
MNDELLSWAQGCLLGALVGDALGSQVEFSSAARIQNTYPHGVRQMEASPVWGTLPGQITDDGEMTLALARVLADGGFDAERVANAYADWRASGPFDCGLTIGQATNAMLHAKAKGLSMADAARATTNPSSQSNGALMRQSPLAVWGCYLTVERRARLVQKDTALTHSSEVCLDASGAYITAMAAAIREGFDAQETYDVACSWHAKHGKSKAVTEAISRAADEKPDYERHQGWVCVALQNAFYQLLHAPSFEEGLVDTVSAGGDTDTNGCIAGALLGAVHGLGSIPERWRVTVLSCKPEEGKNGVRHPRPRTYWAVDALRLAEQLA